MRAIVFYFISILASFDALGDELRFASYYGDDMVLQKAPESALVWGYGPDEVKITVSVTSQQTDIPHGTSVKNGIWRVILDPMEAGGPYNVTAKVLGKQSTNATLKNVLFGDVWLCGGQSNMAYTLSQVFNSSEELALASSFPNVRIFMAALEQSDTELSDLSRVEVPWSIPSAELLGGGDFTHFSAVCWLFGRYLFKTLKYPIGLVESCWGGTPIEAWSSPRVLSQCELVIPENRPVELLKSEWSNSILWNAMIHPLLNMTLKGAIWYQGEANTNYHMDKYSCAFPAMIDDWRMAFHLSSERQTAPDFPFGFVQLSTYVKSSLSKAYPKLRWHQTADYGFAPNIRMNRTFMAVAMDLPDETSPWGSIHPRDKQDVAYRLTLGARAVAYGDQEVSFQGPMPGEVLFDKIITVNYSQKISVCQSDDIFQICCTEKVPYRSLSLWVPAPIIKWGINTVELSTSKCSRWENVAGLRYAWKDWPCDFKACPIYSADGVLPAPPFTLNRGNHSRT